MVSFKAVGYAVAVYLMTQQCQCPQIAIPLITDAALQTAAAVGSAGASFAGAIIQQNISKRRGIAFEERGDIKAPAGVPQQEFDRCSNDMSQEKVHVHVKGPVKNNGVQIDGVPASCMNLATVIDGNASGGPRPTPCGSACLMYNNLNGKEYQKMVDIFNNLKNA